MKPIFKILKPVAAALLVVAASMASPSAVAQQPAAPALPNPAPVTSSPIPATPVKPSGIIKEGYRLEIVQGVLMYEGLKDRIDIKTKYKGGSGVQAYVDQVVGVLKDLHPGLNVVVPPVLSKVKVGDLKYIQPAGLEETQIIDVLEAIRAASGDKFEWSRAGGKASPFVITANPAMVAAMPKRTIEVFNMSGYIEQLGTQDRRKIQVALDEVYQIINISTMELLGGDYEQESQIYHAYRYHESAKLLVVTGLPELVEVARKVVNALPGQVRPRELQDVSVPTNPAEPRRKF